MSSSWKIGDRVICINSLPLKAGEAPIPGLIAGNEYSIVDLHSCTRRYVDVGLIPPEPFWMSHCEHCSHFSVGRVWNYTWRFIKIDPEQLLKEELLEVPVKYPAILEGFGK